MSTWNFPLTIHLLSSPLLTDKCPDFHYIYYIAIYFFIMLTVIANPILII